VRITWIKATAADSAEEEMFLSAGMWGHWSTAADAQNDFALGNQVATAAVVHWDTELAGSATSVMTIPANAAPGYYDLQFNATAHGVGACGTDQRPAACAPVFYEAAVIQVR
jgi:hypothetical protein